MVNRRTGAALAAVAAAGLLLAACSSSSSGSSSTSSAPSSAPAASAAASAPAASGSPAAAGSAGAGSAASLLPAAWKAKGVVNVASDIPYPPMEFTTASGATTGFDYDLSQALAQQLGVTFSFNKQGFDTIIASLQSGKHDIIMSSMNDTPDREKVLDFVDYFNGGFNLLVKKGNPQNIKTLADLCGKTVAEESAVSQIDLIKAASAKCPNGQTITLMLLPTDGDAQTAVRAGKAAADLLDAPTAAYSAQTAGNGQYFDVVIDPANPSGVSTVPTGIGVLKKDADLTKALQGALQNLIQNGTYKQLLDKYNLGAYAVTSATINGK